MPHWDKEPEERSYQPPILRRLFAVFVFVLGIGYAALTVTGFVKETRKIDPVTLGVIILAVVLAILLWSPEAFARLKLFQGFGVKLELGEVKQRQDQQESKLQEILADIASILPILLPKQERDYLIGLSEDPTKKYVASDALREDLRRLRAIGLIERQPNKAIALLRDGTEYQLSDFVRLTALGTHWAMKLREIYIPISSGHAEN